MRAASVAAIIAVLLLAGCAGRASPAGDSGAPDPEAVLGSIGGIVFDDERRPVPQARLTLVERNREEQADSGGRFVFLRLAPGEYTVRAAAAGFQPGSQQVALAAGENVILRIELLPLPAPVAHFVVDQFAAHHACMLYTLVYVTHCSAPYTIAYESLRGQGVDPGAYGLPPDPLENAYRHNFTVEANSTGIVSELVWTPNADATRYMWFTLSCGWYDPVSDGCLPPGATQAAPSYAGKRGPGPLRIQWEHPNPEWLPWVMAKARVTGDIDQYVGLSLDQRLDMFNTVFYGGPVPEDWSILPPA